MKVLVAGASGAIGRPLISALLSGGHEAVGMTSSEDGLHALRAMGADGVIADALNADDVHAALTRARPEVVIEELTSLPKNGRIGWRSLGADGSEAEEMKAAAARDRRVRTEGGGNVYQAASAAGVKRYIVQSTGFFYAPANGLAMETEPLALEASPAIASSVRTYTEIERRVLGSDGPAGIALRYGFFYGPGTWFTPDGSVATQVRERRCPLVGSGQGVWSWVHVEDAASATVAALESAPGIYNIVDNEPAEISLWLPAFAEAIGAPEPPRMSEQEALRTLGPDFVYYQTQLRGASNAKAKRELGFAPRTLELTRTVSASRK